MATLPPPEKLSKSGHLVVYDDVDDTGMRFSITNWRYWMLGIAALFALSGIIMAMVTSAPVEFKSDAEHFGFAIASGIIGLLCTAVIPGIFLVLALVSSKDRAKRGCFGLCAFSALGLSFIYVVFAGIALAVNGSGSAFTAREEAYKTAFETLDSYAAGADKARDAFFDAGGTRVKTLIGEETITYRIALVNKLKIACADSSKLLDTAEPTIDAWLTSANVSSIWRDYFWKERGGHEYIEALKNLRATETTVTASVSEYLGVMRRLNGHFAMADSNNVYFSDHDDLDTYNAALKKLEPSLKAYADAQDRLDACKAKLKALEARSKR